MPIQANREWYAASEGDWVFVTKEGESLHIKVEANPDTEVRSTKVKIVSDGLSRELSITQDAKEQQLLLLEEKTTLHFCYLPL